MFKIMSNKLVWCSVKEILRVILNTHIKVPQQKNLFWKKSESWWNWPPALRLSSRCRAGCFVLDQLYSIIVYHSQIQDVFMFLLVSTVRSCFISYATCMLSPGCCCRFTWGNNTRAAFRFPELDSVLSSEIIPPHIVEGGKNAAL